MDEREFREILDRCLEGTATSEEERLLILAAEESPERRQQVLEISSFDAALGALWSDPEDLVKRCTASIGHKGHTRAFARVMRTRL